MPPASPPSERPLRACPHVPPRLQILFIVILVYHVRRGTLKTVNTVARYGFLFSSYRSKYYW